MISPSASVYGCVSVSTFAARQILEDQKPEARIHGWTTLTKNLVPIYRYCLNCTKFGQLILEKIIKIVATRCQILRLKCIKFDFDFQTPLGEFTALPRPPSWI